MHQLRNFKNFEAADLDLYAPLTILLGRNGSGKTNLVEGVELMAAIARGVPLYDISETGRGGALEVRGGLPSCPRFGTSRFALRLDTGRSCEYAPPEVAYEFEIEVADGVQLQSERLTVGGRTLIDAERLGSGDLELRYHDLDASEARRTVPGQSSVLSHYEEFLGDAPASCRPAHSARTAVSDFRSHLRQSYVFEPVPMSMRNYERSNPHAQLARNGSNLSAALFALSSGTREEKAALDRIAERIRQVPDEPFKRIVFVETSVRDVMAGFETEERSAANRNGFVEARLLSDGTLRMLTILTALETVPERSRIIIEEFDTGLHPSRARLLLDSLTESAARRGLSVVVTTHNPAFMNALKESQFEQVWVCHRDETSNTSRVTRLTDLDDIVLMSISGELGNFAAEGRLEKQLDSGYEKQRERAVQQWLDTLS